MNKKAIANMVSFKLTTTTITLKENGLTPQNLRQKLWMETESMARWGKRNMHYFKISTLTSMHTHFRKMSVKKNWKSQTQAVHNGKEVNFLKIAIITGIHPTVSKHKFPKLIDTHRKK